MRKKKKNSPKPTSPATVSIKTEQHTVSKFSGPLPSPDMFAAYRQTKHDLPELIIEEWLKEGDTRRKYATSYQTREAIKLIIVGIFAFGMLGLAAWLIYKAQYQLGVAVLLSPLAAKIIGGFRLR